MLAYLGIVKNRENSISQRVIGVNCVYFADRGGIDEMLPTISCSPRPNNHVIMVNEQTTNW
jgi:hypothetical protein